LIGINKNSVLKIKIFTLQLVFGVFLMSMLFTTPTFAEEKAAEKSEKYDPKGPILEHIADSHYWHIFGEHALPLPVILYTNKGIEVFSSHVFEHGKETYQGKYKYALIKDKIKPVTETGEIDTTVRVLDFSITRNVASMWMAMIILLIIFLSVTSTYKKRVGKAPKGLQSFMEPLVLFVRDEVAIPNIGHKYARYMPLLLTMFFFILISNLLGLVPFFPGGFNLTGNIAVTIVLATITLITVNFSGGKHYWKHIFLPHIPLWLYPIMIPVEVIGILSRPFALMIRLFANITAGHIVVLSLISLIFIFNSLWMSPVSVVFVVFMDTIELLVAFLQAFIFTMLTALFIGMAVEEPHAEAH
jgi:F-type H+-transporting ATPase subunit a